MPRITSSKFGLNSFGRSQEIAVRRSKNDIASISHVELQGSSGPAPAPIRRWGGSGEAGLLLRPWSAQHGFLFRFKEEEEEGKAKSQTLLGKKAVFDLLMDG